MSKLAIEEFNPSIHRDHMPEIQSPVSPRLVLVVVSGKFKLEFLSQAQLDGAITYFRSPAGSTRLAANGGDHWEFQSWQSRLPAGINNSHNRTRILAALLSAVELARNQLP